MDVLERLASFLRPSVLLLNRARKSSVWPSLQPDRDKKKNRKKREKMIGEILDREHTYSKHTYK